MKKLHLGRSMIEMLGVLAIVGVLSIGGMSMYRKAILNYRLGQTQHWFEMVRFIIAEACANGNANGCFVNKNTSTDYKKRADYVCSQGGSSICPNGYSSLYGSARTPLKEEFVLLYMYDLDYVYIYLRHLDKRTCEAVIDYNWNGLILIQNYTGRTYEIIQSGEKHLTEMQKDHLKSECPFLEYMILKFDLKS